MSFIQQADESILFYILNHLHTPFWDKVMITITSLGNSGFIWIVIAFLLLLNKKTRRYGILLTTALSIQYFLGDGILKHLFARERPFVRFPEVEILIRKPGSFSFPSGHTMSSFTAATIIFYFSKYAGIPAYILAVLIGFSRLYLFCHYPTDVLAGIVFGIITARIVISAARTIWIKAGTSC